MTVEDQLLRTVETLYDAALDEALWPTALQRLADFTDSQSATLWMLDSSEQPKLPLLTILNFDENFMNSYLDGMVPLDPTVQYLVKHPDTAIVHDDLVITEREKDRTAYYDWHGRWSDTRFRLVGQIKIGPLIQAGVALHRAKRSGKYQQSEIERFAFLHRHLQRSLTLGVRLGCIGSLQRCGTELLDANPAAIILVDEKKRVVYANPSAMALASRNDGVRISGQGLLADHQTSNRQLQRLMAHSLAAANSPLTAPGGMMRAVRATGKRPYCIFVSPIPRHYPALSTLRPALCVIITDPDDRRRPPGRAMQVAFGLTAMETQMTVALSAGDSLAEVRVQFDISDNTARTHLKRIFHKTGVRRQAELVALTWRITHGVDLFEAGRASEGYSPA